MKAILTLIVTLVIFFFTSCSSSTQDKKTDYSEARTKMESKAASMLQTARNEMQSQQFAKAKAIIQNMRKECYLALDARAQGILLMDSIELRIAQQELTTADSLLRANADTISQSEFDEACRKVQFYERKLQYDSNK